MEQRPVSARRFRSPTLAVLAAIVLVVVGASCSVSKSDDAADTTGDADPSGQEHDYAAEFADAPVRGLTDDEIRIGIAMIDMATIRQLDPELGDQLPDGVIEALVESVNEDGGINGRRIEPVVRNFLPVGSDSSGQSCRELIEDEEVFAVVGVYFGDNALCVTEEHDTTYFGAWGLNAERMARSNAPYIIAEAAYEPQAATQMDVALDQGVFDDAKVAVYWDEEIPDNVIQDQIVDRLEAAGVDVVSTARQPQVDDEVQAGREMDTILERFEADGADTVLLGAGVGITIPALQRSSWRPRVVFTNGQASGDLPSAGLEDPHLLEDAVAIIASPPTDVMQRDPDFLACLERINEFSDLDLEPVDIESPEVNPDSSGATLLPVVCQLFDTMVEVLEAAGDDPSPSSIVTGMAELESFSIPAVPDASLGPDKWDTGAIVRLWNYDADQTRFVPDESTGVMTGD